MKFDIETFRANPDRKLILRNLTNQGSAYWVVEKAEIALGDIVIIKVPDRNLDFPSHAALDNNYVLKHELHGKIGILEFANEKLTIQEFTQALCVLPLDCSMVFYNTEGNDSIAFGVTKIKRFHSVVLLFCKYGGNNSQCYDIHENSENNDLANFLKCYLEDYNTGFIFIDKTYTERELWGVTFEHENIDGLRFRRLVTKYPVYPFFTNREEAEEWIKQHPDNDFDMDFGAESCSNPKPVLLDRWIIDEQNRCIPLI